MSGSSNAPKVKLSLWRTVKAVLWSFVGIRKKSDFEQDTASLNIVHVIAVGLLGALLFVLGLVGLVHWVVK